MKFEKFGEDEVPVTPTRWWVWLAMLVVLGAIGAAGYAYWRYERELKRDREEAQAFAQRADEALESAEVGASNLQVATEERVRRLETLRAALRDAGTAHPERLNELAKRIRAVEVELDHLRSGDRLQQSLRREREAVELTKAGNFPAAEAAWRDALTLQQDVNRSSGEASRNFDRELRLKQELMRAVAEPLGASLQALLARAAEASRDGKWADALARYIEARDLQDRLNREFPRSRYSDLAAIARIEDEIAALSDNGLAQRVTEQWENARRLGAERRWDDAAKAFVETAETQRLLNERFPRSRFVSMEKLTEIDAERQTALASPRWQKVRELEEQARVHLRRRQVFQGQTAVKEALELVEALHRDLPRARGLDEGLRLELSFLNLRSAEISALQDRAYEQLAQVPGLSRRAMFRGELLQGDFARVMNTNPSRRGGRALPVESITHAEAEEFCRRLSWILGLPVRLPSEAEYRAAVGVPGDFAQLSDGLDEWMSPADPETGNAPVWKGAQTAPERVGRTTRSAQRGFRPLVEVDLSAVP